MLGRVLRILRTHWWRILCSLGGAIITFGGLFQGAEYLGKTLDWASKMDIHWPTVFNSVLVLAGLAIIGFVNWPRKGKTQPTHSSTRIEPSDQIIQRTALPSVSKELEKV